MKWKALFILLPLCLTACHQPTPEEAAATALIEALEAEGRGDHEAYMQHVDGGADMDSAQVACLHALWQQHLGWRRANKGELVSVEMEKVQMHGDSTCTVYYRYSFSDGTKEVSAQDMVLRGEEWKIRLRN